MSRNYRRPHVDSQWADCRHTHMAVATAIHAISDSKRSPDSIWESPTPAEIDHIKMAVEEYIRHGDFPAERDGRYPWGQESIRLPHHVALYGGGIIGEAYSEAEALALTGAKTAHNIDFYDAEDGPGVQGYEYDGKGVWVIDPAK